MLRTRIERSLCTPVIKPKTILVPVYDCSGQYTRHEIAKNPSGKAGVLGLYNQIVARDLRYKSKSVERPQSAAILEFHPNAEALRDFPIA